MLAVACGTEKRDFGEGSSGSAGQGASDAGASSGNGEGGDVGAAASPNAAGATTAAGNANAAGNARAAGEGAGGDTSSPLSITTETLADGWFMSSTSRTQLQRSPLPGLATHPTENITWSGNAGRAIVCRWRTYSGDTFDEARAHCS